MNNPSNILTNMLINNTRTGNQIYDYFINFIILSSITYFFQHLQEFNSYLFLIYEYFNKINNFEIIMEAESVIYDRAGIKTNTMRYSKFFKSVTYYIKKLNSEEIYSKREPDKCERDNNSEFDFFIPDQDKPFFLNKEIKCLIKMKEYVVNNSNNKEFKKKHIIKVFSENKNIKIHDLELFLENCLKEYNEYIQKKTIKEQYYFCFKNAEENGDILNYTEKVFKTNRTFDTIFFENKDKFIENLDFFLKNDEWYNKKGIPYHYGILLHGSPGCGKTSIIKAILEYTKRHAFVIPLNRVKTCGELDSIFFKSDVNDKYIPIDKRIFIFEDIDCLCNIVKDRGLINSDDDTQNPKIKTELDILCKLTEMTQKKPTNPEDELNLSGLLNAIDGILETPGRIIILTSNYPKKIDKALIRPGRIDMNIELKKASVIIMKEILQKFYEVSNDIIDELCGDKLVDYQLTPAEIINICQMNKFNLKNTIDILQIKIE